MNSTNLINKHIPLENTTGHAQPVPPVMERPIPETVHSLFAAMSPPLKSHYQILHAHYLNTTKYKAQIRYAVGLIIEKIKSTTNENLYGAKAVERMAKVLGRDHTALYRAAKVTLTWSQPEFDALIERRTIHGQPISWSHLVELSLISSTVERNPLIERILAEGLSVRDTVAAREELPSPSSVATAPRPKLAVVNAPGKPSTGHLRKMVKLSEALAKKASDLDSSVFQNAVRGGAPPPANTIALLEKARVATEGLVATAEGMLAGINAALSGAGESPTENPSKVVATSQVSPMPVGLGNAPPMA